MAEPFDLSTLERPTPTGVQEPFDLSTLESEEEPSFARDVVGKTLREAGEQTVGGLEAIANLFGGFLEFANPTPGIFGIVRGIQKGSLEEAGKDIEEFREYVKPMFVYEPRTEAGEEAQQQLSGFLDWLIGSPARVAGETAQKGAQAVGGEIAGAVAGTAVQIVTELAGYGALFGAIPMKLRGKIEKGVELTAAEKAQMEQHLLDVRDHVQRVEREISELNKYRALPEGEGMVATGEPIALAGEIGRRPPDLNDVMRDVVRRSLIRKEAPAPPPLKTAKEIAMEGRQFPSRTEVLGEGTVPPEYLVEAPFSKAPPPILTQKGIASRVAEGIERPPAPMLIKEGEILRGGEGVVEKIEVPSVLEGKPPVRIPEEPPSPYTPDIPSGQEIAQQITKRRAARPKTEEPIVREEPVAEPPSPSSVVAEAPSRIQRFRNMATSIKEGIVDFLDVEAPLRRAGAPETAFAQKNYYSRRAKEEEVGIGEARENAKLFKFDDKVAPDVVLAAEDPIYFKNLSSETQAKVKAAAENLRDFFEKAQKDYAERGVKLDFKQRILDELDSLIDQTRKHGMEEPGAAETLSGLKEAREIAQRMNFVHIPTAMWFTDFLSKDPIRAGRALKLLAPQKRKSLTINSLIERGLVERADIHPADIIASYSRRKGRDFALLDFVEAAKKEGLASLEKQADMVQVPAYIAPILSKYWLKRPLADIIYDMTRAESRSRWGKFVTATKMMQFYNPLFLPMYDIVQGTMLSGLHIINPKLWKAAVTDVWRKTPEYWQALENGLASKPFNAPWNEFQRSLELAKKSNPDIAKFAASGLLPHKLLKTIYQTSWHTAWHLDKTVRMVSYRYLRSKGFSPRDAAQTAAKFHADYASVPPKTRRMLNNIFFTPAFKITMGKLFANMIKNASETALRGKPTSPISAKYARGAVYTFTILQAYDSFMVHGLGFNRDEWGRRYIKKDVETDKGKRDLVVTWSSPANMFLKYLSRAKTANRMAENTEKVKSFIEMNKWEFHPIYRSLYDMFWTNRTPSGDDIINPFDPPLIKVGKRLEYLTKSLIRVIGLMDKDKMDKAAMEAFAKETSKAYEVFSRPFVFTYMRQPGKQRLVGRLRRLQEQFQKTAIINARKGIVLTPKQLQTFKTEYSKILDELRKLED